MRIGTSVDDGGHVQEHLAAVDGSQSDKFARVKHQLSLKWIYVDFFAPLFTRHPLPSINTVGFARRRQISNSNVRSLTSDLAHSQLLSW